MTEKVGNAVRLVALDRRALALGLVAGLTLADARARTPELTVDDLDPHADARLMERLADDADRWSPMVALDPPHGLMLDITGGAHLFGGEAALRGHVIQRMRCLGLSARAAVAGTPECARALARFGRAGVVPPGGERAAVAALPVAAQEAPPEATIALTRAGQKTLRQLPDRPTLPLSARFGQALSERLRRMLGQADIRIRPRRPLPAIAVERGFAEPIGRTEDIEAVVRDLTLDAIETLQGRGEGGRAFETAFFRTDGEVFRLAVETGRPSRDAAAVMRLYREKLDALADPLDPGFGFDLIRLSVMAAEPLAPAQADFEGRAPLADQVGDLVDRLTARFGRERVKALTPVDTHNPDRAQRHRPAAEASPSWPAPWLERLPDDPPGRPLQLFDPPQPIEALAEVPDGPPARFRWRRVQHAVAFAEGPERIAPEWWLTPANALTRDYFRLEDSEGRRFWVFREGLYERETEAPRWFLHGVFA
ncbi:MAG: DNA polymerase Y family protein [Caulobacteraceae bacterium]|nr:DNA polymerase Y family protein [Caulobacteraceae bacterium]